MTPGICQALTNREALTNTYAYSILNVKLEALATGYF